jgi:Asp-tRNA(Asn)/Glu-tRNA(Gln) amidotransferase C subunit
MVSDDKRAEIQAEAKAILDKFGKALKKVKVSNSKDKNDLSGYREEGEGQEGDSSFREAMFENAPESSGDAIIAEKKKW